MRTQSQKNEGLLGEKPNFGSKLGALSENVTFDLSVSALKAEICPPPKKSSKMAKMINLSMKLKQKVASCGSRMQKIGGL